MAKLNRDTTRLRFQERTKSELIEKLMDLADEVLRLRDELKRERPARATHTETPGFLSDLFR